MSESQVNYRKTLVISDNKEIISYLNKLLDGHPMGAWVNFACSPKAPKQVRSIANLRVIDLKSHSLDLDKKYQLVISAHCKQIFPKSLHTKIECINIHPGYNPDTRGWFPQVWAITQQIRTGITIHRIDEQIDHGNILARLSVPTYKWDTSYTLYHRTLDVELEWLRDNLVNIVAGNYTEQPMESSGNLFLKSDFDDLCELDLTEVATFEKFYDRLRALSFPGHRNAYFINPETNEKIFLELKIVAPVSLPD